MLNHVPDGSGTYLVIGYGYGGGHWGKHRYAEEARNIMLDNARGIRHIAKYGAAEAEEFDRAVGDRAIETLFIPYPPEDVRVFPSADLTTVSWSLTDEANERVQTERASGV